MPHGIFTFDQLTIAHSSDQLVTGEPVRDVKALRIELVVLAECPAAGGREVWWRISHRTAIERHILMISVKDSSAHRAAG